jgi:hypothetical protein
MPIFGVLVQEPESRSDQKRSFIYGPIRNALNAQPPGMFTPTEDGTPKRR